MGEDRQSNVGGQTESTDEAAPRRTDRRAERRLDLAARSLRERNDEKPPDLESEECPPSDLEADDPRLAGGP